MTATPLQRRSLLAASAFVLATTLVLLFAWRLVTPSSVVVTFAGATVYSGALQPSLRFVDTAVLVTAAFVSGASAMMLLSEDRDTSPAEGSTERRAASESSPEAASKPASELLDARREE